MYICYEGHEEIVHEGRDCPACQLKGEVDELQEENEELREKIKEYE